MISLLTPADIENATGLKRVAAVQVDEVLTVASATLADGSTAADEATLARVNAWLQRCVIARKVVAFDSDPIWKKPAFRNAFTALKAGTATNAQIQAALAFLIARELDRDPDP